MSEPTGPAPVAGEPPGPSGPSERDRRRLTLAVVAGIDVVLLVLLLVVRIGGDDDEVASGGPTSTTTVLDSSTTSSSTTTTSSTSSTSTTTSPPATPAPGPGATTTTTRPTTTTTTTPPSTIAPARCTGRSAPDDPAPVAELFYEAWTVADRTCAERIATEEAIEQLFRFDGSDADWSFQGCAEDEDAVEPHSDCLFRYEGGTAVFDLRFGALRGWQVHAVEFIVD